MSAKILVEWVSIAEFSLCTCVVLVMWKRKVLSELPLLAAFLGVRSLYGAITLSTLFFRRDISMLLFGQEVGFSKMRAYDIYFFSFWPAFILQAILMVMVVYSIYSLALAPFEPLKKLGNIVFRWIAAIALAVTIGVAIGPHTNGQTYLAKLLPQLQQTASVLTLCLLLFVCFALRPLGLTERSRAFGASIGLGFVAVTQLVQSAWLPTPSAASVYSMINFYGGVGFCAALVVWGLYFALPEPERRMVLLPTTSPYFFWNKISEALGDAPGFVAVSGFSPDSMAPGELEAMLHASQPQIEASPRLMQPMAVSR